MTEPTDGERFDHGPAPTGPIPFTPPARSAEAEAMADAISQTVHKVIRDRFNAIEAVGWLALHDGHGVRVDDYTDGGWSVMADYTNPNREIREYRHAHPQDEPPTYRCLNCESRRHALG